MRWLMGTYTFLYNPDVHSVIEARLGDQHPPGVCGSVKA